MHYERLPDRMPPLSAEEMSDVQKEIVAGMIAGPRGKVDGPYWAMLRSPGFTKQVARVGDYFRFECALDKRYAEMTILLVARSWTQQFQWSFHAPLAVKAGLKQSVVDAIGESRRPAGLSDDEQTVYDFVSEVLANKSVSDATYARAVKQLGEGGVMDLLAMTGYYTMLATIINVTRLPLGEDTPLPLASMPAQVVPR